LIEATAVDELKLAPKGGLSPFTSTQCQDLAIIVFEVTGPDVDGISGMSEATMSTQGGSHHCEIARPRCLGWFRAEKLTLVSLARPAERGVRFRKPSSSCKICLLASSDFPRSCANLSCCFRSPAISSFCTPFAFTSGAFPSPRRDRFAASLPLFQQFPAFAPDSLPSIRQYLAESICSSSALAWSCQIFATSSENRANSARTSSCCPVFLRKTQAPLPQGPNCCPVFLV
jgi:hypothetical protein